MSIGISLIILLAAVLHASWNALLRAGTDRLWSITMMCIAIALVCGGLTLVVAMPARASWGCAILSALFHVGYNLFLVRTYRVGDLGQTYPIARGSSPLLVSLGAAVFAGELPDPIIMAGVLLVSGGIISLAFQGRRLELDSLSYALGTGCFIGAYSVTDGIGVRLSGTPIGYTIWMCLLWGVMMLPVYALARDWRSLIRGPRELGGGGWRYRFTGRIWDRHICDVARPDGAGVGSPRNQRCVRCADRPFLFARTANRLPYHRLPCRRDWRDLHRA